MPIGAITAEPHGGGFQDGRLGIATVLAIVVVLAMA